MVTLEMSKKMKGLACIGVFVLHIPAFTGAFAGTIIGNSIGHLGYLCVAVFFFLSGYGLQTQYGINGAKHVGKMP